MSDEPKDSAREIVAWGIAICLILLGIGGCCVLGGSLHVIFKDFPEAKATK